MVFAAGGHVQSTTAGSDCGMRRLTETFTADQWSQVTAQTQSGGDATIAALVRCHPSSTTDESCYYMAAEDGGSGNVWRIYEVSNTLGFTNIASTAWAGAPLAAGETVTAEAEGTTLRLGTNEGGGDTERLSTTDATLGGATYTKVGFAVYTGGAANTCQATAWTGGSIAAAGGTSILRQMMAHQ